MFNYVFNKGIILLRMKVESCIMYTSWLQMELYSRCNSQHHFISKTFTEQNPLKIAMLKKLYIL